MQVSSFYTQEVVTAGPDTTIFEAAQIMRREHVGDVVILDEGDGGAPQGILTDRDIVVSILAPDLDARTMTVSDVMSFDLVTVGVDDDLGDAIEAMTEAGVRRLPVVDADRRLAGVLSLDDIVRVLGRYMEKLSRLADIQRFQERIRKA